MNLKNVVEALKIEINTFCTENITFRLFTRSDAFPLYQATLNPEFNKKLAWGPPESFDDVILQTDLLIREMISNQSVIVSMVEKNTGAWIGIIKLTTYKDSVIQSLWVHPNYWNKPIIAFGACAILDIFFRVSGLKKLYAKYIIGHETTKKILQRNGWKYIYNDPIQHTNGELMDCEVYELTYEKWLEKTTKTKVFEY